MTTQFLDCTLRDGGYYTNWDFDEDLVSKYLAAMQATGIDVIEIGYRNPTHSEYKENTSTLPLNGLMDPRPIRQQIGHLDRCQECQRRIHPPTS